MNESEKELWFAGREINECINKAISGNQGPVHINIPLEEPLHDLLDKDLPSVKNIEVANTKALITEKELEKLATDFNGAEKILILAGQQNPNLELEKLIEVFAEKSGAVVLKEQLSNLNSPQFCGSVDLLITYLLAD